MMRSGGSSVPGWIMPKRILVIATRQIGDVLLTTPLLHSLRLAYPEAVIDVLTYQNTDGMLVGNPDLNRVLCVAEHPNIAEYWQLLGQILRRYDLAVSTLAGDRPLLYALLAAPRRIGSVPCARDGWKRRILDAWFERDDADIHTIQQNLRLADLLGIARSYALVPPRSDHGEKVLDERLPFSWRDEPFAVLHLLPMWHYKRWTTDGWRALMRELARLGLQIVITGGSSQIESAYVDSVLAASAIRAVNLVGRLRIAEVASLLRAARIYVGPDTAMTHLAASIGIPTVALYGPTNPIRWGPWPFGFVAEGSPYLRAALRQRVGNVLLIQAEGECVPCAEEGCDRHKGSFSDCLQRLSPERVIEAAVEMLGSG